MGKVNDIQKFYSTSRKGHTQSLQIRMINWLFEGCPLITILVVKGCIEDHMMEFISFMWPTVGAREREIKWSHYLVIWSRNHEYSIFSRKDFWSYYQSLDSKFRYALGKVLDIQDRPTLKLISHHCVLYLSPIENHLNTCILDSHTH